MRPRLALGSEYAVPAYDIESPGIDNMSCHFDIMSPCKTSTMQTSKAFRCMLPMLRDDQLTNLRRWAELHCAQSIVFRDDRGNTAFVGLKAELRTCASFSRTVRTALRRLCIDAPLRGRWSTLRTPREALSICAADNGQRGDARDTPAASRIDGSADEDIRIVALHRPSSTGSSRSPTP